MNYGPGVQSDLKRANVVSASSGANTLIAAVTGKKIRVVSISLIAQSGTAVNAYVYQGSTALLFTAAAPTPFQNTGAAGVRQVTLHAPPGGWLFDTAAGVALSLDLSGAVALAAFITYVEVE